MLEPSLFVPKVLEKAVQSTVLEWASRHVFASRTLGIDRNHERILEGLPGVFFKVCLSSEALRKTIWVLQAEFRK